MEKSVPVIAIDGTAASGKGTMAKRLAAYLDYAYLDTGLLYRRVALTLLAQNIPVRLERFSGGLIDQIVTDNRGRFSFTKLQRGY